MSTRARVVVDTRLEGLRRLGDRAAALGRERVLIGIPAGAVEPDGTSSAQVGAWMEYGVPSRGIPERPWLSTGIRNGMPYFKKVNTASLRRVMDGTATVQIALDTLGVAAVAEVKHGIVVGPWAPNAPATVARKGSDKPLVDTTAMLNSVTHVVEPVAGGGG